MRRALAGRIAFALALVLLAYIGVFLLIEIAPGDPLEDQMVSGHTLARQREIRGLNASLPARLATRVARLAVLDLGTSLRYDQPVRPLVLARARATLQAGTAALLLALALGIPAGVAASRASSPLLRHGIATVSIVLLSLPALVVALVLTVVAADVGIPRLAVMVIALALPAAALLERLQARAMDAALAERCLDAARARGVPRATITWRHAWPLSLPAVLGVAGTLAGQMLSGALAIELVTSQSGLGLLTFEALQARDVNLAAGCAATVALIVALVIVAADALQLWLDPRVAVPGEARLAGEGRLADPAARATTP